MKNDRFPTTSMLIETIRQFLGENMLPQFLDEEKLQLNLVGYLVDNGYDVLSEMSMDGKIADLMIRLSDGFMPIEIKLNPQDINSVTKAAEHLNEIVNAYKDIRNGYIICLLPRKQQMFAEGSKLLYKTNEDTIVWWGGRIIQENGNALKLIEPIWIKEKLKLYGLKRNE